MACLHTSDAGDMMSVYRGESVLCGQLAIIWAVRIFNSSNRGHSGHLASRALVFVERADGGAY